ncbi:hypothetical protein [Limibacillus sp. MBR-115]|jgi:hypothetical protein|uniref:cell division protein FtsL n=1 Tax=Limibacillus sp. MBR-115 TaxID=3156465 RepID=UPI003391BC74
MIRWSAFLWSVVGIVMAIVVFQVKYKVQELEGELAAANARILHEQETIQVLRAEWSYLNRPARISELAQRYLEVGSDGQPVTFAAAQLDELPLRLEGVVLRAADAGPLLPQPKPSLSGPIFVAAPSQASPDGTAPSGVGPAFSSPAQADLHVHKDQATTYAATHVPTIGATLASFGGTQ